MQGPKIAQVCFVMDCTQSMQHWIEAAKNRILDTLSGICQMYPEFEVQVAFLGYRDFKDTERFIRMNFTKDHIRIQDLLSGVEAKGGDDDAEDIAGAYAWLNSLRWDGDVQMIFHIADAPNHGKEYHAKYVSDNYPEGNLSIDLREEVRTLAIKHIDITLFRLNGSTDITYDIMSKEYRRIRKEGFEIAEFLTSKFTPEAMFHNIVSGKMKKLLGDNRFR
jgi:hypothetical protein